MFQQSQPEKTPPRRAYKRQAVGLGALRREDRFEKPTPERMRQNEGVKKELISDDPKSRAITPRYRARGECMLDVYLVRRQITISQHAAGIKFRNAYLCAVLKVQTRNFMMVVVDESGGAESQSERESSARFIVKMAMKHLNIEQRAVLIDVAGNDMTAGGTRKLEQLTRGLEILADLWHIKQA